MMDQGRQDIRKDAQQLIAEAQAARVQADVRAMLSRIVNEPRQVHGSGARGARPFQDGRIVHPMASHVRKWSGGGFYEDLFRWSFASAARRGRSPLRMKRRQEARRAAGIQGLT